MDRGQCHQGPRLAAARGMMSRRVTVPGSVRRATKLFPALSAAGPAGSRPLSPRLENTLELVVGVAWDHEGARRLAARPSARHTRQRRTDRMVCDRKPRGCCHRPADTTSCCRRRRSAFGLKASPFPSALPEGTLRMSLVTPFTVTFLR